MTLGVSFPRVSRRAPRAVRGVARYGPRSAGGGGTPGFAVVRSGARPGPTPRGAIEAPQQAARRPHTAPCPGRAARLDWAPRHQRGQPVRAERRGSASALRAGRLLRLLCFLLCGLLELLGVLLTAFLCGLLGAFGGLLRHLLTALAGLLSGLLDLLLDLVRYVAELLVLHPRGGDEHAGQEAHGDRAERNADRVLLRHARRLAGAAPDVLAAGRCLGDARAGASDLGLRRLELLARPCLDIGLVTERLDRVAHAGAGILYLLADFARVLAHSTSSFTDSWVCSGTGGVACCTLVLPVNASTPDRASQMTVTISAASHSGMAVSSAAIAVAVSAPRPSSTDTPAPPNMPAPRPARLPFCAISALARSSSWRTSVVVSCDSCLSNSPVGRSRKSSCTLSLAIAPSS